MELEDLIKKSPDVGADERGDVTREELYTLVWDEPMLKVAATFEVSSSYMARVCTLTNVLRPERGYSAKLAVGKAPAKPPLPDIRPGDQAVWNRSGAVQAVSRPVPRPPIARPALPSKPTKHNTCEQSYQWKRGKICSFQDPPPGKRPSTILQLRFARHFRVYDHLCEIAISDIRSFSPKDWRPHASAVKDVNGRIRPILLKNSLRVFGGKSWRFRKPEISLIRGNSRS
jgi:hypothetical protein